MHINNEEEEEAKSGHHNTHPETNTNTNTNTTTTTTNEDDDSESLTNQRDSLESSASSASTASSTNAHSLSTTRDHNIYDIYKIEKIITSSTNSKPKPNSEVAIAAAAISISETEVPVPVPGSLSVPDPVETNTIPNTNTTSATQDMEKWSCSVCTYLNWPKSLKCVQCYTLKAATTAESEAASNNERNVIVAESVIPPQLQSTKIELVNSASPKTTPLNRSLCNSPCTVPKAAATTTNSQSIELVAMQTDVTTPNPTTNHTTTTNTNTTTNTTTTTTTTNIIIDETAKKWSCSACTYQNWPKAQRCVMCHIPRHPTTTSDARLGYSYAF